MALVAPMPDEPHDAEDGCDDGGDDVAFSGHRCESSGNGHLTCVMTIRDVGVGRSGFIIGI